MCAVANFGGVDVLINSAGAARGGDILALDAEFITEALTLKTYGYLRMSQLVIPHMKKNGWGRIVNIAGGAGASPARGNIPTSAANITVLNNTRALSGRRGGRGDSGEHRMPGHDEHAACAGYHAGVRRTRRARASRSF